MKVLVVDDEEPIRDICSRILRSQGHEVAAVPSGDDAIPLLLDGFDIVLTDIMMPGKNNGLKLLKAVREKTRTDVIIMTAFPEMDTALEALRQGAYDYLIKPFTVESLTAAVNRCAERRDLSEELARERAMRRLFETFGHFSTPEVADYVLKHPNDYWKRGERRDVTVLFSDVRNFTPFAGRENPEHVVEALNEIFAVTIEAVHAQGGIVNKFIGDGVLAIFGAPVPLDDHAGAAARAALRIRDEIGSQAARRKAAGQEPLRIGIGLSSGSVVAGCLGTKERAEYSVIGHIVNLAARLEGAAGPDQILVSEELQKALDGRFKLKPSGEREFQGMGRLPVAELLSRRQS